MPVTFEQIAPDWKSPINCALKELPQNYWAKLNQQSNWLPGPHQLFNAFSQPLEHVNYILLGESPYPRSQSANGYAFWDAAVENIWAQTGLAKEVNRATSLRNFIKMLLVAGDYLEISNTSQPTIAALDKMPFIQHLSELFQNLHKNGFLLLNASLVLSQHKVNYDANAWRPFMNKLLEQLALIKPDITLVLFGNLAKSINRLPASQNFPQFHAEHPYNVSFISNQEVQAFFKPFHLLLAS